MRTVYIIKQSFSFSYDLGFDRKFTETIDWSSPLNLLFEYLSLAHGGNVGTFEIARLFPHQIHLSKC